MDVKGGETGRVFGGAMKMLEPVRGVYILNFGGRVESLDVDCCITSVAVIMGAVAGRMQKDCSVKNVYTRDEQWIIGVMDRHNLLFDAWRFFVSIHSLIVFVETQALDLNNYAIVLFFDTLIFCRIMVMVATALGHKSRDVRQVKGRSEGRGWREFLLGLKILKERQDMAMNELCKVRETSQKATNTRRGHCRHNARI